MIRILALLVFINFTWDAPPIEQNVSKVEVRVAPTVADHDNGTVYDAGLPPVVNNKQSYTVLVPTTMHYGWVGFRNTFGVEEAGPIYLGKPQAPTGVTATP